MTGFVSSGDTGVLTGFVSSKATITTRGTDVLLVLCDVEVQVCWLVLCHVGL